jgi:hypothetical protein
MANKTTLLWGIILVSVSSACDQLRLPKAPGSATSAESASGQTPPKPAPRSAPARAINTASEAEEAAGFDGIRTGLRRLVVAEETFFAENGTYTNDLDRLQYKPGPGNSVRFLWMSGTGWAASGTHEGITGKDCVIYVGRDRGAPTTLKYVRKSKEGVPVCDTSPRPAPRVASKPPAQAQPKTTPPATTTPATTTPSTPRPTATSPGSSVPDTSSALDAVNPVVAMKVDLRNLVRSQQTYFAQQGLYARSTEPFALQYLWHRGVTITILSADVESWSARATHAGKRGKSCVIWFGPVPTRPATSADKRATDQTAEPVCDD